MHEAILYKPLENDRVLCTACKMKCRISEGQSGVCGVRINEKGKLYLLVYGKASAVNIDPIEKKPLYHFLPGTEAFSIGTVGCNFGCTFCQNWDLSQVTRTLRSDLMKAKKSETLGVKVSKYGYHLSPEKIVETCLEKKIPIIAYTYNEPIIFFEYLYDCARLASREGIKNIFVSNGYESEEALDMMGTHLDAMNIDLKAFTEKFYNQICKAKLQPVLDTIAEVHERGIWLEITTLLIPGENDSEAELTDIARFIAGIDVNIPWHISRFYPNYLMLDKPSTPEVTLRKAWEIGKKAGLHHVYIGNLPGVKEEHTYCPSCNQVLIRRHGYHIEILPAFDHGHCRQCQTKIAGIWNG